MRLALALVLAAATAHADPATPWSEGVSAETQASANALFKEGYALYTEGKLGPAIDKYRAALAIWDHPAVRFNLAYALIEDHRELEAADELDRALRYGSAPFDSDLYRRVLVTKELVAHAVGDIEVRCDQPGVHVLLDGKPWFDGPGVKKQRVLAGAHAVVGQRDGLLTTSQNLFATGGTTTSARVQLVSLESAVTLEYPRPRWLPYTIGGGGVAVALTGLGVWLAGRSKMEHFRNDLATACPAGCDVSTMPLLANERDGAELEGNVGVVLMTVGGAAVITGVVLAVTNRPRRVLPHLEASPTPGGAAARATWQF
jgi:hypothetical protein